MQAWPADRSVGPGARPLGRVWSWVRCWRSGLPFTPLPASGMGRLGRPAPCGGQVAGVTAASLPWGKASGGVCREAGSAVAGGWWEAPWPPQAAALGQGQEGRWGRAGPQVLPPGHSRARGIGRAYCMPGRGPDVAGAGGRCTSRGASRCGPASSAGGRRRVWARPCRSRQKAFTPPAAGPPAWSAGQITPPGRMRPAAPAGAARLRVVVAGVSRCPVRVARRVVRPAVLSAAAGRGGCRRGSASPGPGHVPGMVCRRGGLGGALSGQGVGGGGVLGRGRGVAARTCRFPVRPAAPRLARAWLARREGGIAARRGHPRLRLSGRSLALGVRARRLRAVRRLVVRRGVRPRRARYPPGPAARPRGRRRCGRRRGRDSR